MDDTRNLNDGTDPLRDLFLDVGPAHSAPDLESDVLAALAKQNAPVAVRERPLIPGWAWGAAALLGVALALWPQAGVQPVDLPALPSLGMSTGMRWTLSALACGVVLFALDSVLNWRGTGESTA